MKPPISAHIICLIILAAVCYALAGCAQTKVREGGKTVFSTQANADELEYRSPAGSYLHIRGLDHSTPTLAGGQAFSMGVDAGGRLLTSAGLAFSSSGISNAAGGGAAALTMFNRPSIVPVYRKP